MNARDRILRLVRGRTPLDFGAADRLTGALVALGEPRWICEECGWVWKTKPAYHGLVCTPRRVLVIDDPEGGES